MGLFPSMLVEPPICRTFTGFPFVKTDIFAYWS